MKLADLRTRDGHPDARAARIYRETLRSARDVGIPAWDAHIDARNNAVARWKKRNPNRIRELNP